MKATSTLLGPRFQNFVSQFLFLSVCLSLSISPIPNLPLALWHVSRASPPLPLSPTLCPLVTVFVPVPRTLPTPNPSPDRATLERR